MRFGAIVPEKLYKLNGVKLVQVLPIHTIQYIPTICPRTASLSDGFNLHKSKRWSDGETDNMV